MARNEMMRFTAFMIGWMLCFAAPLIADDQSPETIESKISAARGARTPDSDQTLRKLAIEQAKHNQPISSLKTLGYIRDPRELAKGVAELRLMSSGGSEQGTTSSAGTSESQTPSGRGALGGASLADFSSLMELIQTTVVPDTWEALGGPSTMSPYPGGILVDGAGLVSDRIEKAKDASLDNLAVMLNADRRDPINADDRSSWRHASAYRCVSLKRLAEEIVRRRVSGQPVDDAMRNLAGLSRVQFVIIDPPNQDVILAGPVGGIESHQGWFRDQKSGLTTIRLEYFTAAAVSIVSGEAFGCTIDPTQQSLAAAAETSALIREQKIPVGLAAEALQKAIGLQDVRVFGTAGDTPLGYLMVEADRHMKQLALGFQPMPKDVPNYLDFITRHIAEGPPNGQLLRLWFTGVPMAVRVDTSGQVYEMAGRAMKLDSETKLAGANGERAAAPADIRVQEFVESFNQNFIDIATEYPVYGALHSVYASAAVAELLRRSDASDWIPSLLGPMLLDDSSEGRLQTPRKVESIATLHRVKQGSKRHSIIVASGGVWIDTRETVAATYRPYPTLSATSERLLSDKPSSPDAATAWWWNAK
jgi:hypothetical protein